MKILFVVAILAVLLGTASAQVGIGYHPFYGTPVFWTYDYGSGMYQGYDMTTYYNPWWTQWFAGKYYQHNEPSFYLSSEAYDNGAWMNV